ncbi:MAG: hybrid sensor histidine kinase/response regulator, partial [Cyanobacteriota bacterium]
MPILGNPRLTRTLPLATFERLQALLKRMQSTLGEEAVIFTEDVFSQEAKVLRLAYQRFTVLVSEQFSALLLGEPQESDLLNGHDPKLRLYQVGLTFDPGAIASFLSQLTHHLSHLTVAS